MNLKNRTIILYQLVLFFLLNLVSFFIVDFLIRQIPFLYISGNIYLNFFIIVLFWGILLFINIKLVYPFLKKGVKKIIRKHLLRNKKRRKFNKYVFAVLIVAGIFLFQFWNIDLLIQKYSSPVFSFININRKNRIEFVERADFSGIKSISVDPERIRNISESSDFGRFLRTYRWSPFIEKAEKAYGIEEGLLAGLIMQESYGNPLQLNSSNDGGVGLMMFQPGTAKAYGLKTYGSSTATGKDKAHGLVIKSLLVLHNYNYSKLAEIDQRFHIALSIDAGARFLSELYLKYGSWDKAISAFNRGTPARLPNSTQHVRKVRYFQKKYLFYFNKIEKS